MKQKEEQKTQEELVLKQEEDQFNQKIEREALDKIAESRGKGSLDEDHSRFRGVQLDPYDQEK